MTTKTTPPPRPAWTGALSFGLVSVPLALVPVLPSDAGATGLSQATVEGHPVGYKTYDKVTGAEISRSDIHRAATVDGRLVLLSDDDLQAAVAACEVSDRTIEVHARVPVTELPLSLLGSHYMLTPGSVGAKRKRTPVPGPLAALAGALGATRSALVVRFALRSRPSWGVVYTRHGVCWLATVAYGDEARDRVDAPESDPATVDLAVQVLDQIPSGFDWSTTSDPYRAAIEERAAAVAAGTAATVEASAEVDEVDEVVDIMALLKKALATRGGAA